MARKTDKQGRRRPQGRGGHRGRRETGVEWLYGEHAVAAALANPARPCRRLVTTADPPPAIARALDARPDAPPAEVLERRELDRLLHGDAVHQGVALQVGPLPAPDLDRLLETDGFLVVLDQVTDPHNVGAILRSAAAFGIAAVITQDRHSPQASGLLAKAASGALERVPLVRVTNLARTLDEMKRHDWWVIGLDGDGDTPIGAVPTQPRTVIVLGAEGQGLRRLTRETCDIVARIPISGAVESLNVANAAAIAFHALAGPGLAAGPD